MTASSCRTRCVASLDPSPSHRAARRTARVPDQLLPADRPGLPADVLLACDGERLPRLRSSRPSLLSLPQSAKRTGNRPPTSIGLRSRNGTGQRAKARSKQSSQESTLRVDTQSRHSESRRLLQPSSVRAPWRSVELRRAP